MAFAAAEDESTGITLSDISLQQPHIKKNARFSASFPFIKPQLTAQPQQNVIEVFKQLKRTYYQKFKIPGTKCIHQKDDLSQSMDIIRELAAELDRVVQSKMSLKTPKKNIRTEGEQKD
ncbi:hypothetical protein QQF64_033133 [Cirrhinus molitorella]|uniref:Uncharacterized protein n=1 Tax=Cirrhinus molitorella TaxID=172907 RepID=A0ABR3MSZ6_9TELE